MSSTATPTSNLRRELAARPQRCRNCGAERAAAPVSICDQCLGPLDPVYDPARPLPDRETIAARAPSLWRYKEWLPFDGDPVWSLDTGFTPLVDAAGDRKSTRLNSSHSQISYAVFCLKKKSARARTRHTSACATL